MDIISIIIPAYNVEKYINRCLNSIVNQTYKKLEVIIVDDGSIDDTAMICEEYCKKYQWIQCIHKKNEGLGFARNTGLNYATGEYVTFVDGDDYILPTHIEKMYSSLINNNADTCFSGYIKVFNKKKVEFPHICTGKIFNQKDIINEILPRMCGKKCDGSDYIEMSVCMVLFSNRIIKQNKLKFHSEREFISEDLIFDTDYYPLANKVCVCDSIGYCYCDNEASLTTKYNMERFVMQKKMTNEIKRRTRNLGINELCEERINTTFISIIRYCIKLEQKFSKQIGIFKSIKNIRMICCDSMVQQILLTYQNNLVQTKSRVINYLIKTKHSILLWIIMMIKNKLNI